MSRFGTPQGNLAARDISQLAAIVKNRLKFPYAYRRNGLSDLVIIDPQQSFMDGFPYALRRDVLWT